jgi:glycosyltransferase involved in cell wall biosynthesis
VDAKIVHLAGQTVRGGAERQLLHLACSLRDRGWPQAVVSFSVGGAWRDRWTALGIPLFEIPRTPIKPWRLWQLSCILRRQRPSIIQVWSPHLADYARWAWGKRGARLVFGVREDLTINRATGNPLERLPRQRGLEGADYAIGNSQSVFERLERRGVRLPPHEVIGNIVIPHGNAKPGEAVPVTRIVAIGALRRLKAYDVLLEAAARLAAQGKSFELLLAGDGEDRQRLEALASKLNMAGRVRFLGEVEDIPNLLANAQILVHPSKSEGLSNTILEGMAEGLPVVGNWESAAEILDHERTGLLVPAGYPDALAEALGRLLDDPPLRERLGNAALQHVREHCNVETITQQYERAYRSMLKTAKV